MADEQEVEAVEVDCPRCGNANRAARRRCRYCNRTGKVTKYLPTGEQPDG